jgi:hypothetical protein
MAVAVLRFALGGVNLFWRFMRIWVRDRTAAHSSARMSTKTMTRKTVVGPPSPSKQEIRAFNRWIEYNGRKMILSDWAKELGITHAALIKRLDSDNWTVGQALGFEPSPPRGQRNVHLITYDGKTMPIVDWARLRGISWVALSIRLSNPFWTIGQALGYEPPPERPGDSNSPGAIRQRKHREKLQRERERLMRA